MNDLTIGLILGTLVGIIISYIIYVLFKDKKETDKHDDEDNNNPLCSAEEMSELSNHGLEICKHKLLMRLNNALAHEANEGNCTLYMATHSLSKQIEEYFTKDEITEILENLGYQVKFSPFTETSSILMIRWGKDKSNDEKEVD